MKLLLTGFGPFGQFKVNPSQVVAECLTKKSTKLGFTDVVLEVLPTEYVEAGNRITRLIRQYRPEIIICLGLASEAESIRLERVAINLDDAELPDNIGLARHGELIIADGPPAYWSTLSIEKIARELMQRGILATISNHAGTYICNHVFYLACHEVEQLGLLSKCGFIHLPPLIDQIGDRIKPSQGMPLDTMVEAIECCISISRV